MASKRPRRGRPGTDALVEGDTGPRQPQGGARVREIFRESGDLQSREFGVPQADVPGGKTHVVNPETHAHRPPGVTERPADYHKYHGVESDDGGYETPDTSVGPVQHAYGPARLEDAVPVYVVEKPGKERVRRDGIPFNVNVPAAGSQPARICNIDTDRVEIQLLNEDSSTDIRISNDLAELLTADAQGTGAAGAGALIWHGTNSYTKFETQGELFAITTSTTLSARLSVIIVTEVRD